MYMQLNSFCVTFIDHYVTFNIKLINEHLLTFDSIQVILYAN